jgi:phospholipid transport system substrate-binding protein
MVSDRSGFDRRRFLLSLVGIAAACLPLAQANEASASAAAEQFVSRVADQALSAARSRSAPAFRRLVNNHTAISAISRFSLGKYARRISKAQNRTYRKLIRSFISRQFVDNAKSLAGQRFVVKSSRARTSRDIIVKGTIVFAGGREEPVEWRVVRSGSRFRVFDVKVKGIWLALNMRSQFTSVLNRSNGDMNELFAYLKKWS